MSSTDRPPLSRDRIATAALDFIDAHGLGALSMRKLGAELGVEAMSLYNHVANKADLLGAVTNALYGEVLAAYGQPEGDWKVHARALCHAYVDVAGRHPHAVSLLIEPAATSPSGRAFDARIVAAARLMTDDLRVGVLAFSTVANWVIGTIVQDQGVMRAADRCDAGATPVDEGVARFQHVAESVGPKERFDEGLETVLAGLEARFFPRP